MNITHTIYYVIADNDLELCAVRDVGKLMFSNVEHGNNKCIIDILIKTKKSIIFIHIFNKMHIKELRFKKDNFFYSIQLLNKLISRYNLIEQKFNIDTHKILIISGHNCGWYIYGINEHTDKDILYLDNLRKCLEENNIYLDAICFDSCFGSNMEVIMEFNHVSEYIVASPEYMYFEGICSIDFCKYLSNIKSIKDIENALIKLISDLMNRSNEKKEPLSLSLINNRKFKKIIDIIKNINFVYEDFTKKNVIDKCHIWLKNCEHCDPNECEIFYDLYNTIKDMTKNNKMKNINFAEFSKIFNDSIYYKQNKYFKGVISNGIDISLSFVDVFLIKKMNYIKTFKRLIAANR